MLINIERAGVKRMDQDLFSGAQFVTQHKLILAEISI